MCRAASGQVRGGRSRVAPCRGLRLACLTRTGQNLSIPGLKTTRVAAVSMNGFLGDPARALNNIDAWCGRAAAQQAELVLFPELVIHGHCTPRTWEIAEAVPSGPSVARLEEIAARHRVTLVAGLSEKERDIVYNTAVVVGPQGYIGKQRKIHCSRDESFFYKGGRTLNVFDLGGCKIGIVICYDNQFPEIARILALRGADLILMPHAGRFHLWDETAESQHSARKHSHDFFRLYALRARENACFAVLTDQVGRAGDVALWPKDSENQPHHAGAALIWGPDGKLIAITQEDRIEEEMLVATLDPALLARERSLANYMLRTRRPELFEEIVKEQVSS
jgi:N-carbamoylputrescine amidase